MEGGRGSWATHTPTKSPHLPLPATPLSDGLCVVCRAYGCFRSDESPRQLFLLLFRLSGVKVRWVSNEEGLTHASGPKQSNHETFLSFNFLFLFYYSNDFDGWCSLWVPLAFATQARQKKGTNIARSRCRNEHTLKHRGTEQTKRARLIPIGRR